LFGGDVAQIPRLLEEVRLLPGHAARFPHELSGGEKQRVAIARAFAARPRFVICDEITASLDVSVAASVIELLLALRAAHGTAYLFITHELNRLVEIAHRVAVMRSGRLVDLCPVTSLGGDQVHAYTRELIAASSPSVSQ
jgi:peptide/nickel transport system ATP-binding protein